MKIQVPYLLLADFVTLGKAFDLVYLKWRYYYLPVRVVEIN